ncbi:MAG: DNA-formamidopyrimidine glycosylase family protein [Methanomassiliicoccales archaeon]|jgi:formamidopyrimidine-DNA glycosylase
MPELPEVEQARRYLETNALNRRILSVEVFDGGVLQDVDPPMFRECLTGRSMTTAGRRGKQLFIGLDDGSFLTVHLGMTGDLTVDEDGLIPKHSRIAFRFEGGISLFYSDQRKFGAIGVIGSVDQFVTEHRLGPDALCINQSEFRGRVSGRKKAIKSVLLDQSVLSGVGNLYADEALFQARLHPATRADSISQKKLGDLQRQISRVLRGSIAVSSDFSSLPDGYLLRVRNEGTECPRGNGLLALIKVGGRTSIFCPKCQQLK